MANISLLDCTLRDGGYVNDWNFGREVTKDILEKLVISQIEIIECGYISQEKGGNPDKTQFATIEDVKKILPRKYEFQQFAVMINYGEYNIEDIPDAEEDSPIIRVCFHKKSRYDAILYCNSLIKKGYKVFVQAMAALNYSDVEYIDLIEKTNDIKPYGFYIVDSFGVMELKEFQRLISLTEHNLDENIILGYHSHNNLQQAYENAKFFVEQNLQHKLILDASVYGIGRGAGNLNMELFAAYLNKNYEKSYNIDCMLEIMDEYLKPIFMEHFWGYSLPFYLSAQYNCHPNYAIFLAEKNTLSNKSISQILAGIPEDEKNSYSEDLAEKYYQAFQEKYIEDKETVLYLKKEINNRKILILAPGKSLEKNKNVIKEYIKKYNPIVFAINVLPLDFRCDYLMCTNEKRIRKIKKTKECSLIITSNIMDKIQSDLIINYSSYLMSDNLITDNPTLILLNLLINMGIQEIFIAGFDGYSAYPKDNYFDESLSMGTSLNIKLKKNKLIKKAVKELSKVIKINFITESLYE